MAELRASMEDLARIHEEREKPRLVDNKSSLLERTGSWIRSHGNVSVLAAAAVVGTFSFLIASWARGNRQ